MDGMLEVVVDGGAVVVVVEDVEQLPKSMLKATKATIEIKSSFLNFPSLKLRRSLYKIKSTNSYIFPTSGAHNTV